MNPQFLDKQSYRNSWTLVCWTSLGLIASSFCLVLPAAIQTQMAAHFEIDDIQLYLALIGTLYFLSNAILPFFSGCIRDGLGDRFGILFLNATCVFGQLIVTFGVEAKSLLVFGIGRIILGWGIESLLVVLTSFIAAYYRDGYFTLMVGVYQWVYTLGFVLCIWYAPVANNVVLANTIALVLQILGLCTSIVAIQIDNNVEKNLLNNNPKYFSYKGDSIKSEIIHMEDEGVIQFEEEKQIQGQQEVVRVNSEYPGGQHGIWYNFMGIGEMQDYPKMYWLLFIFYGFISISILVLVDFAAEFLTTFWLNDIDGAEGLAWKMVTLMWLITGTVTPLFGLIVDLYGQRSTMTIFSGLMCIWAHLLVLLQQPFDGLLLLGFAYALSYTTVWSAIIYLTEPNTYGKSLSLLVCFQNFGIAVTPIISNYLRSFTQTGLPSELFLMLLAIISFFAALLIYKEDEKQINIIDRGMHIRSEILSEFYIQLIDSGTVSKKSGQKYKQPQKKAAID